ncbi:hydroxysteroid dehydrogenase-like protein 2 [Chironomus tepperi]|uniref:hydroxysteroid dehydrogenase-like protein 2 n=1 Tax=Chironomus tepperi TaxID=113505 RepID=UPI00391F23EB
MINTGKLAGKTLFITGASRGIGKAIALKAARDGANIVIASKTAEKHSKLEGTIYATAQEVEKAGGKALPCIVDVRNDEQVKSAVEAAVKEFGGIDIVVNNASAIYLTSVGNTDMKKYDLMNGVITRGTFLVTKECLPYLKKSNHAHVLNLAPKFGNDARWFQYHTAYTIAKYGSSMCTLGMSEEFKRYNIAVNALWPNKLISTAAVTMLAGPNSYVISRKPEIMSDAAYLILTRDPKEATGNFYIDDEFLIANGITDMKQYSCVPGNEDKIMELDAWIDIAVQKMKKQDS